ncbi:MAG: hypothetical protein ACK5MY_04415 [Jhaorihella sp.]
MPPRLHAAAGIVALLTICTFWLSTAVVELTGDAGQVAAVKTAIVFGMALLIPAMAAAGASGAALGRRMRSALVATKARRMKIVAANGLLILLPSAVFLALRAQSGIFDSWFLAVQAVELAAGAANITLLALNLRDGLRLSARRADARA